MTKNFKEMFESELEFSEGWGEEVRIFYELHIM